MIELEDLPLEIRFDEGPEREDFLPVPLDAQVGSGVDLTVLFSTLLELRHDIKEIKALLAGGPAGSGGGIDWPYRPDGRIPSAGDVVETFSEDSGYGPLQGEQAGDLQTAERSLIESALRQSGGNRRKAADRLGISERTLYRKIKLYDL
jgi:hypothetical protein